MRSLSASPPFRFPPAFAPFDCHAALVAAACWNWARRAAATSARRRGGPHIRRWRCRTRRRPRHATGPAPRRRARRYPTKGAAAEGVAAAGRVHRVGRKRRQDHEVGDCPLACAIQPSAPHLSAISLRLGRHVAQIGAPMSAALRVGTITRPSCRLGMKHIDGLPSVRATSSRATSARSRSSRSTEMIAASLPARKRRDQFDMPMPGQRSEMSRGNAEARRRSDAD